MLVKSSDLRPRILLWDQSMSSSMSSNDVNYKRIDANTLKEVGETFYFEEAEEESVKIIENDFAGIGTRQINSKGVNAINNLFKRSF